MDSTTNQNVKNFKRILVEAETKFDRKIIEPKIFEKFCSEITLNPDKVPELLSKNLEKLKVFSAYQRSHMFDLLLDDDFSDPKIKSEAIFYLYNCFSDSRLFWNIYESTKIKLVLFSLREKTIKGLKLFIFLNSIPFLVAMDIEENVSKLLYNLFTEYGYDKIFFQGIKVFNQNFDFLSQRHYLLFQHAPPEMILECNFEFIQKYFCINLIFDVFIDYFTHESTAERAVTYYFHNIIQKTSCNPFSIIATFLSSLNSSNESLFRLNRRLLEIFLNVANGFEDSREHVIEAYKFYRKNKNSDTLGILINLCLKFEFGEPLLKTFVDILDHDLFAITMYPPLSMEKKDYIFEILNKFKEKKEDYKRFNFSYPFYIIGDTPTHLLNLLNQKNRYIILKKLCETSKVFNGASKVNLQGIIKEIYLSSDIHGLYKLLLANAAASDSEHLVKMEFIYYINETITIYVSNDRFRSAKKEMKKEIEDYLKKCLKDDVPQILDEQFSLLNRFISLRLCSVQDYGTNIKNMMSKIDSDRLIEFVKRAQTYSRSLRKGVSGVLICHGQYSSFMRRRFV